jgi:hypothetical protein
VANELNTKDKPTTMKTKLFSATAALLLFAILFSSCSSSKSSTKKYPDQKPSTPSNSGNLPPGQAKKVYGTKSAKVFAPGQQKKQSKYYPIIVYRTPDIIILRHADGRYYYKNKDNFIYWQGSDDRFYLDEQHLDKVEYDKNELDSWKTKGKGDDKKTPPGQVKKEEAKTQHSQGNEKKKSKKD